MAASDLDELFNLLYPSDSDLSKYFQKLKSNLELNETFDQLIQQRHKAVREAIESKGIKLRTQLIGSLQRKTRIRPLPDGKFDIDILVELGEFYNRGVGGISADEAVSKLDLIINTNKTYQQMDPHPDRPTITFSYADNVDVELVPAYRDKIGERLNGEKLYRQGSYWVPKNFGWDIADYDYEASYISRMNQLCDGWLIPTIKILKSIKREHFKFEGFDSFHFEVLACEILPSVIISRKQFGNTVNYPTLIESFFQLLPQKLSIGLIIPGSNSEAQSINILTQIVIMKKSTEISEKINKIKRSPMITKIQGWREIIGSAFPTTI